jgi:putative addiction module killer protein
LTFLGFLVVAASPWEIEFYELANGEQPCQDWLDRLSDGRAKARINLRLDRVRAGNFGDYKSVGQGVFELRMSFGPGYRIYFGILGEAVILLLLGGDKGSQAKDIQRAQEFWKDYRRGK